LPPPDPSVSLVSSWSSRPEPATLGLPTTRHVDSGYDRDLAARDLRATFVQAMETLCAPDYAK
jgi:hypothetical protein